MDKTLLLVKLDANYCDYLRQYDNKVPYNYGNKELRPFIGVLFEINNCKYFAPLSSPKAKHLKLKSKIDLLKIANGKLGVVNFNNMLPVKDNNVIILNLKKENKIKKEEKYIKLLQEQLYWLNRHKTRIYNMSQKLYNKYINNYETKLNNLFKNNNQLLNQIFKSEIFKGILNSKILYNNFNNIIERAGKIFNFDESNIYNIKSYNHGLLTSLSNTETIDIEKIMHKIKTKNFENILDRRKIVKYFYQQIINNKLSYKYILPFRVEFLVALYIYIVKSPHTTY